MAQVAKSNKNTIVVVNSVGPINMEAWVNHPNVTAIVSPMLNANYCDVLIASFPCLTLGMERIAWPRSWYVSTIARIRLRSLADFIFQAIPSWMSFTGRTTQGNQ